MNGSTKNLQNYKRQVATWKKGRRETREEVVLKLLEYHQLEYKISKLILFTTLGKFKIQTFLKVNVSAVIFCFQADAKLEILLLVLLVIEFSSLSILMCLELAAIRELGYNTRGGKVSGYVNCNFPRHGLRHAWNLCYKQLQSMVHCNYKQQTVNSKIQNGNRILGNV